MGFRTLEISHAEEIHIKEAQLQGNWWQRDFIQLLEYIMTVN